MSDEPSPEFGPATDPVELERAMKLGSENPAYQGLMFRLLLGARLWVPIPAHPEMEGDHLLDASGGLSWVVYRDHEGDFTPVFTTEEFARKTLKTVQPEPMIAEAEARVLFSMFKDKPVKVRVIASNQTRLVMEPKAVVALLEGDFTENTGNEGATEKTTLHPLTAEQVPMKLRQAICVFCVERQGAIAIYAFNSMDEATGTVDERDLRFIVRLRDNAGDFYNDFALMVTRLRPKDCEVLVAAARLEDEEGMAFLQRCTPLWPVMAGE